MMGKSIHLLQKVCFKMKTEYVTLPNLRWSPLVNTRWFGGCSGMQMLFTLLYINPYLSPFFNFLQ